MPESALRDWRPAGAWDGLALSPGRFGAKAGAPGVTLQPLDHRAQATIVVREGQRAAFSAFASERWGLAVPDTGKVAVGTDVDLVWSAPNQILVTSNGETLLDDLAGSLKDVAAVTQQGDGRALVVIGGPSARRMLAKLVAIDLHPNIFVPGIAAVTGMTHGSVQIWLRDDAPSFMLASPRTSAGSTWTALMAAAVEYGVEISSRSCLASGTALVER